MNPRSPKLETPIEATGAGVIPAATTLSGTITTVGTAVTGSGTSFTSQASGLKEGDFIYANEEVREVVKVISDTEATLDEAFGSDVSGVALNRCRSLYRDVVIYNSGAATGLVQGGNLPSNVATGLSSEYGYPVKPIAYDATGTTFNIYFVK